ncbi:MAG: phosphotransferase [Acidimicrobiales bacterium]
MGRTADVFDAGPGRVLRRYKLDGYDASYEAKVMRHVFEHGYPVPQVFAADGPDLVMERVTGPTMLKVLLHQPWRAHQLGGVLADMLQQLHLIEAPSWMPDSLGPGDAVLHLDLHLSNVIMTKRGPVVIDWRNARRGAAMADVANTWLVLATAGRFGQAWWAAGVRSALLRSFLRSFPVEELRSHLPAVASLRAIDTGVEPKDRVAAARLLQRLGCE